VVWDLLNATAAARIITLGKQGLVTFDRNEHHWPSDWPASISRLEPWRGGSAGMRRCAACNGEPGPGRRGIIAGGAFVGSIAARWRRRTLESAVDVERILFICIRGTRCGGARIAS